MDYSLPGSSVQGIIQTRILEWVAISFCRGSSEPRDWNCLLWVLHWQADFYHWATWEALNITVLVLILNNEWWMATAVMSNTLNLQNFNQMIKCLFWKNEGSSSFPLEGALIPVSEDGWSHLHFLKNRILCSMCAYNAEFVPWNNKCPPTDAGKDWGQEEKGVTEDERVG